jgi:hypothetical protein
MIVSTVAVRRHCACAEVSLLSRCLEEGLRKLVVPLLYGVCLPVRYLATLWPSTLHYKSVD